jgi:RNA polymerase sigma-70 factor (ECF subfamily)
VIFPRPERTGAQPADADAGEVRLARSGDYAAFERLVHKHERRLYSLAIRIVRRPEDAEEIVQETFLSAVEHLPGFEGRSTFQTWLLRIASNHALKLLRKRRGLPTQALDGSEEQDSPLPHPQFIAEWWDDPREIAQRREARREIDAALDRLDAKYRLVFLLRDVEGLSTEETAEALGITVANAKVRLLRARLALREDLTRTFGDEATRVTPHVHD